MTNNSFFLIAAVVVLGLFFARYCRLILTALFKKVSQFFPEEIREHLFEQNKSAQSLLIFWFVCSVGFHLVPVEEKWQVFLYQPLKVILAYSLILLSYQILDISERFIALHLSDDRTRSDSITTHLLPYSKKILKILVTIIAGLLFLQNSGFNVTSLLAGLGIGGVAIALAAKETLGHFFGGLSVIMDKPFAAGDWIVCGEMEGTVVDIGFRSTKVKTFYDSLMTIPNAVIADSVIDNLGKRTARRTRVTLDINYDTPPEKIEAFVEGIKNIIQSNAYTRKDYYQCYFSDYTSCSLQIFLNFFLKVKDWDSELLQKQNIFLEILRLAKELKVDFSFPTQTLNIPSLPTPGHIKKQEEKLSLEDLRQKAQSFGQKGHLSRPQGLGLYTPRNKE